VVNGDVFIDLELSTLLAHLDRLDAQERLAHLILVDNPEHNPQGDFVLAGNTVQPSGAPRMTFSGLGLYHPALFADVSRGEPARLAPLLRAAMARGMVTGERYDGLWIDVGTPQRLAQLNRLIDSRNTR